MAKIKKPVFFINALKNPAITGSIVPSQRFLVNKLVAPIEKRECEYIIELGAGNGCVTKRILERRNIECKVMSFEINKELADLTAGKYMARNFVLINDDAGNLLNYAPRKSADFVISSIPLGSLEKGKAMEILESARECLKDDGMFIQYQYFLANLYNVRNVFSRVNVGFTPLNFPPAFVYKCFK